MTTRVAHNRSSVRICTFPGTRLNHPTNSIRRWSVSTYCRNFPMRKGRVVLTGYNDASRPTRDNYYREQGGIYQVTGRWYDYRLLAMVTRTSISAPRVAFTDGVVPLRRWRVIRVGRDRLRLWLGFRASGGGDICARRVTGIKRSGDSSKRVVLDAYRACGPVAG